ncbi:MAG: hypothetical protein KGI73_02155 [Patescibacteria group bacterium]|nr:hypothetical protein [Patescibacteria group bacterium]
MVVDAKTGAVTCLSTNKLPQTLQAGTQNNSSSCGWDNLTQCILDAPAYLLQVFADIAYGIFFLLVWFAASILDFSVTHLIIQMGSYITDPNAHGVQNAWTMVRDLTNIGIIGGFIAVGISTILQIQSYSANKFLARLIIAALLVNFSYFFAGAVIDSSNYLATQIYDSMIEQKAGCTPDTCTLTSAFMEATNFQSVHDDMLANSGSVQTGLNATQTASGVTGQPAAAAGAPPPSSSGASPWLVLWIDLLSVVFELVTVFIFLAASGLIVGRFVALILLLIASPIGIAGLAIPFIDKYARQWWSILFSQAFFAPVYFLLLDISFMVISDSKARLLSDSGTAGQQALGVVITFMVASVFMVAALRAAKKMSESGSQYFGDIYKGAEKANFWPRLYTSGLKTLGGYAGTNTVGRGFDTAGRAYEKWVASSPEAKSGLRRWVGSKLAGSALDRNLQRGFNAMADKKFGGRLGYKGTLEEIEGRNTRLSEVQKFKAAQDAQPGLDAAKKAAQDKHDALRNEYGETKTDGTKGKRASVEDALAMEMFGKNFGDLTDEQKKAVMADKRWEEEYKDLDALAREWSKQALGTEKGWSELSNEERAKFTEAYAKNSKWKGRQWVHDKDKGTYGWEAGFPYYDRLRRNVDLNTDADREAAARAKYNKSYAELTGDEKDSIKQTLQGAIDNQRTPLNEVSWSIIKEEHLRNPHVLSQMTSMLSNEQYMEAMADKTLSKSEKNKMRKQRLGPIMDEAQAFENNVVELGDWEKMSADERQGKVLRGSAEYDNYRWALHERLKKYYTPDEIVDYVESDVGVEKSANGKTIRQNRIFNDAVTNGVYKKLQDSKKISSGEKRSMRNLKRTRYENAIKEDEQSEATFSEEGIVAENERDAVGRDDFAQERYGKSYNDLSDSEKRQIDSGVSYEEFEKIYRAKGGSATKEGRLLKAAWMRKKAEGAADRYFGGKNPTEVSSEVKQESFGTRLAGKYMRREQLLASRDTKDQAWQDKQAFAMAVHGSPEEVNWLLNTSDGQNYRVDWDRVNAERESLGLPTVKDALANRKVKTAEEDERDAVEIAEDNARAAGVVPTETKASKTTESAEKIRTIINTRADTSDDTQSIENLHPEGTVEPIEEVIEDMTPAEVVDMAGESPDLFESTEVVKALDVAHAGALIRSDRVSPKMRRTLLQNLIMHSQDPAVRKLIWKEFYDLLTPEQKRIMDRDAEENGWQS